SVHLLSSFSSSALCLHLHSFPTRRSSDLDGRGNHLCNRFLDDARQWSGSRACLSRFACDSPTGRQILATGNDVDRGWMRCFCVRDRKSTRLNSSHVKISYAVFCLKKKKSI